MHEWIDSFPGAVTVTDAAGTVIEMNAAAREVFGEGVLGAQVLECHPEPTRTLLADMMKDPRVNSYLVEKKGKVKLIYQAPWYRDGAFAGYVEISLVVPDPLPRKVRK